MATEVKQKSKWQVSFTIRSKYLVPDQITQLLNIQPTYIWMRDTDRLGIRNPGSPYGMWQLDTPKFDEESDDKYIRDFVELLESKKDIINKLLKDDTYGVHITLNHDRCEEVDGICIDSDLFRRMTLLCKNIFIFSREQQSKEKQNTFQ